MISELIPFLFILLVGIIILLFLIRLGILDFLDYICTKLRNFIADNHSFFILLFIFVFFIEQLILIILGYIFKTDIAKLQILISIFALIVVTTATLQKTFLEIKLRQAEKLRIKTVENNEEILEDINDLIEENVSLIEKNNESKKEIIKLKKGL